MDLYSKNGTPSIRVGVIGTCRLDDPLITLRDSERGHILWTHSGFAHSIHDAAQWVAVIRGEKSIPEHLCPFIFGHPIDKLVAGHGSAQNLLEGRSLFGTIDVLVIELSTKNRIHIDDYDINSDYLATHLLRPGGIQMLDWWSAVCRDERPSPEELELLAESASKLDILPSEHLLTMISQCRRTVDIEHVVVESINEIQDVLPNVEIVIISHPDPAKADFTSHLADFASSTNSFRFLSPMSLFGHMEVSEVFKGEGKDMNHYVDSFYPIMGEHIRRFIFSDSQISIFEC
jgi:hypothetical protein